MKSYSVALRCGSFTFEWLLFKKLKNLFSKKQRKHFPCFYTVVWTRVEVWEDEILQWEDVCFYNVWENDKNIFYFFYKITPRKLKRGNSLLYYIDASVLRNRSNTRKSVWSSISNKSVFKEKIQIKVGLILCKCFITYPNSVSLLISFVFSSWIINEFEMFI